LSDRNAESRSRQHAKYICRDVREVEAVDAVNLLTGPEMLEMTDSLLPEHRERLGVRDHGSAGRSRKRAPSG
jgi:hypothetical protein